MPPKTDPLGETFMTIGKGTLGFMGFRDLTEQSTDLKTLKLWLWLKAASGRSNIADWQKVISALFNTIVWEDENAEMTIRLAEPLQNPEGLLKSLSIKIEKAIKVLEEDYWAEINAKHEAEMQAAWDELNAETDEEANARWDKQLLGEEEDFEPWL